MIMAAKVGIIFCGGCNPHIDRKRLANKLGVILKRKGCEVLLNDFFVDYLVYLSGCVSGCAAKYDKSKLPALVVAGKTLNFLAVGEKQLVREIVYAMEKLIATHEKNSC